MFHLPMSARQSPVKMALVAVPAPFPRDIFHRPIPSPSPRQFFANHRLSLASSTSHPRPRILPIQAASTSSQARARSFAVGQVARFLKTGRYAQRVGSDAPVYLFAVLEYLSAEVLELARNAARRTGSYRGTSTWL
ncbi:hypothetical protein Taro_049316 [Colocasia esculenta]|uniref:Histone H2A n=1 Tax=Colocasia esculenta TaxID=4460 RepID=A0A843XAQ1_COLES|nr:hypothetical protein [Colocasia esculenta]